MKTYAVTYTQTTRVPGYCPEYTAVAGADWGQAYDFARALPQSVATGRQYELRCGGDRTNALARFYTELRDGAAVASLEVWSHQTGIVLGHPFTPELLGTITARADAADGQVAA